MITIRLKPAKTLMIHQLHFVQGSKEIFLRTLLGGCSTPISALAVEKNDNIIFQRKYFFT